MKTKVYLVGAGPGDPGLLTLRAAELLSQADVILYDALVGEEILKLFRPEVKKIYTGKRAGQHSLSQEEINDLIVQTAREIGGTIVRLKGGDPFVFGRGGEEVEAIIRAGLAYEVVPGITAGLAVPSYAGIPVTHREISRSVTMITASTHEGGLPPLDWEAIVRLGGTLVFYMSMRAVAEISSTLIAHGYDPTTPAAIISRGTERGQRILKAKVEDFTPDFANYEAYTPALFVVGKVVSFAEEFNWFEKAKPLLGQSVVVTRSLSQGSELAKQLEDCGAKVTMLPTIEIRPLANLHALEEQILNIKAYQWLVFTSTNAIEIFMDRLFFLGFDQQYLKHLSIAVVGPATAQKLEEYNLRHTFMPKLFNAETLGIELSKHLSEPTRLLHPSSVIASHDFSSILHPLGHRVEQIGIYENAPIHYDRSYLETLLSDNSPWITFCSSSSVHHFMELIQRSDLEDKIQGLRLAAIGGVTASAIESYGLHTYAMPTQATIFALAEAICQAVRG